jgi:hypothetical protein
LNIQIAEFAAKNSREVGSFLFQSKRGSPMRLKTARNRLHKLHVEGSIAFAVSAQRDFANATYRKTFCVTGLVHDGQSISDRYSKLAENAELRKEWAGVEGAGLGFDIRLVGGPLPKPTPEAKSSSHAESATPSKTPARKDPKAEIVTKHSLVRRKPV